MIEKLKLPLLYITYGMIICCVAAAGFLLRDQSIAYPIAAIAVIAAIASYLIYTIKHCRAHHIDLSTRFTGNMYFSIVMLLMCIAAYAEDLQEESWWPLVIMAGWCCTVDLVRCLLNVFSKTPAADTTLDDTLSEAKSSEAMSRRGISMGNSTRYCLMTDLYLLLFWLATIVTLLSFEGFTTENIIDKVPYVAALIAPGLILFFDKCVTIDGRNIKIVERIYYRNVCHMTMSDISYVTVRRTIHGHRMTFHYGNNQKVTAFPADVDEIVKRLKLYNVDVRVAEEK